MTNIACYLETGVKENCFGCGACAQKCTSGAITMEYDNEGFQYPHIDVLKCKKCKMCITICPCSRDIEKNSLDQYVFGGYIKDTQILENSTSGGAFTAIVKNYCDKNYVIIGATADKDTVYHIALMDKNQIQKIQKSKYCQSEIKDTYNYAKKSLDSGKKVIFSGTPCQIAGLYGYLNHKDYDNLLTIEMICEGVPSKKLICALIKHYEKKYNSKITNIDYRYKGQNKWDFQIMSIEFENKKTITIDRWFNPFWSIWLNHLISRPSCYSCPFTTKKRIADITLGDLWGVHIYCPELYNKNKGASLIIGNSSKGINEIKKTTHLLHGHELDIADAIKYQSPMRKTIEYNPQREKCISDLTNKTYPEIIKLWSKKTPITLLCRKYFWGNRQKVYLWNIKKKMLNTIKQKGTK